MRRALRRSALAAGAGMAAALPAAAYLWHFTVDDAFIIARYACHIVRGEGYRFNIGGPVTDGVTPLGWAYLMAPFAAGGSLTAWRAAKILGLCAWLLGAAGLAFAIDRLPVSRRKWAALSLLATSAPLGAWSVAGMETGVVIGLGSAAVVGRSLARETWACGCAGIVAALRPESLPWALALAWAPPVDASLRRPWRSLALSGAPFLLVCGVRWLSFGRPLPLASLAKTPDWAHGWRYALASALLCGLVALVAWRRLPPWVRGLQAATGLHFVAIAIAGGDWMPLSRLVVPALPGLSLAAAYALGEAHPVAGGGRLALALAGQLWVWATVAPRAAAVGPARLAVIEELRVPLSSSRVVATLDVGWAGVAHTGSIVDLAGVTDPAIAVLPGGHTSKQVTPLLLAARDVDTLVLMLAPNGTLADPWTDSPFARSVELRVASMPGMAARYRPVVVSSGRLRYVVLRSSAGE